MNVEVTVKGPTYCTNGTVEGRPGSLGNEAGGAKDYCAGYGATPNDTSCEGCQGPVKSADDIPSVSAQGGPNMSINPNYSTYVESGVSKSAVSAV